MSFFKFFLCSSPRKKKNPEKNGKKSLTSSCWSARPRAEQRSRISRWTPPSTARPSRAGPSPAWPSPRRSRPSCARPRPGRRARSGARGARRRRRGSRPRRAGRGAWSSRSRPISREFFLLILVVLLYSVGWTVSGKERERGGRKRSLERGDLKKAGRDKIKLDPLATAAAAMSGATFFFFALPRSNRGSRIRPSAPRSRAQTAKYDDKQQNTQ